MEPDADVVVMRKGKMMVRRHGEWHSMDMVMTLQDGSKVAMDGTLVLPDGTSRMLMDGEAITMDGEMTTMGEIDDQEHAEDEKENR